MTTMQDIEKQAEVHAQARAKVATIMSSLQEGIDALKRSHMAKLKAAVNRAADTSDELLRLVNDAPELFTKPKSVVLHGIRIGYQKEKGRIEFDDSDRVVQLIRKYLPDQADVLIATTEKPVKDALGQLNADQLRKLGVSVVESTEVVFIRPADSDIDKAVNALLKDFEQQEAA